VAATLSAGLLMACGGPTTQVNQFVPQRILALGDELNYLSSDGHKYSVNSLNADKTIACDLSPLWIQTLATTRYNKVFTQCVGSGTDPSAFDLSTVDSRVDDLSTQIGTYISGSGFQPDDLVTVLVGMHDVMDAYALYDGGNASDLEAQMTLKGQALAGLVNTIIGTGARVLVSTVPDMGLTPYAVQQKINVGDDRPALLTTLSEAFNKALRLNLVNDGSKVGLLLADDLTRTLVKVPASGALANVTDPACTTALPNCSTDTVVDSGSSSTSSASTYLWADELHPGPVFHARLGQQAIGRVNSLPF
jgi:phospholipase/lecithinase/hemolysin